MKVNTIKNIAIASVNVHNKLAQSRLDPKCADIECSRRGSSGSIHSRAPIDRERDLLGLNLPRVGNGFAGTGLKLLPWNGELVYDGTGYGNGHRANLIENDAC